MLIDHEHGGAVEFAGPELFERGVSIVQFKSFYFRFHRDARRDFEEFFAVAARQVRDGSDYALVPKIDIWKRRDVAHVNSTANNDAAFYQGFQRDRDK